MSHHTPEGAIRNALAATTASRRARSAAKAPAAPEPAPPGPPARTLERPGPELLTALTTEHFTLQTARVGAIGESAGRATLFLSTVAGGVVAMGFIGQVSRLSEAFYLFALVLLPALFAMGLLTYLRLTEIAIEDAVYGRAINRLRRYYIELDPFGARYFLLPAHDDVAGMIAGAGRTSSRWHLLSHSATMVVVVTSLIGGVAVALLMSAVLPSSALVVSTGIGLGVAAAVAGGLLAHQARSWRHSQQTVTSLFPTPHPGASG